MTRTIITTPSDTQVRSERAFDAAVEAVYAAHTTPEIVQQWMVGPDPWTMPVCDMDVRPGGTFRYEYAGGEGEVMLITGTFEMVEPPHRLVHIEDWNDGSAAFRTETTFVERDGQCVVTQTLTFPSKEQRDGAMTMGMMEGMEQAYVKLEAAIA